MTLRGWRECATQINCQTTRRGVYSFLSPKPSKRPKPIPPPPRSAAYRTVSLPVWQDAYSLLDTVGFLEDDLCTPLGVYVASLLHGVRECGGGGGAMCVAHMPFTMDIPCTVVASHCRIV